MAFPCVALDNVKKIIDPPPVGEPHSVPILGTKLEGRSAVYRHWRFQDHLLETLDPEIKSIHDSFEIAANRVPKNKCLGHRPYDPVTKSFGNYVWQDYETVQRRRKNFGAGLVQLHKAHGIMERNYGIGLWCQNSTEWQITDLAAMSQGLFTVSLYDTLGPDTTEYIINHANLRCVVTSLSHVSTLLKLKPRLPALKLIICLEPLTSGELPGQSKAEIFSSFATELDVQVFSMADVEAKGEKTPMPYNPPTPDDTITISYTSGTTGDPKGVVLKHKQAVAAACCAMMICNQGTTDVVLSFLPLAHIYQRVTEHCLLWSGNAIGYFHGNIAELVDDLKLIRPTIFNGVPRLYNRFGTGIKAQSVEASGIKGALSRQAVSAKMARLQDPDPAKKTNKHFLYDRIWSRKVAAAFGLDRCHSMVTGSAPIDPKLHQFLRVVFANNFAQAYGMTETYAVALSPILGDLSTGTCGAVCASNECCLESVPDMEYLATDSPHPRGELLVRGNTIFAEYYENPTETEKNIDADGWLHTGDICSVDELGIFRVIDRKKSFLKLAQGEYISPEKIENVFLANCGWLATSYVHGDSHQSFLISILGVTAEGFAPFASKVLGTNISPTDVQAVEKAIKNKKVEKAVVKELDKVGKKDKFNSYERIRAARLFIDPFTIENQLLTPTLKLKRPQAAKVYRETIDQLYEEGLAEEAAGKQKAKL